MVYQSIACVTFKRNGVLFFGFLLLLCSILFVLFFGINSGTKAKDSSFFHFY